MPCARRAADVDEHASSASPSTAVGDGHGTLATLVARAGGDPSMLRLDSLQATVLAELIRHWAVDTSAGGRWKMVRFVRG